MGVYNVYENIQLKIEESDDKLITYKIGDEVPIKDGIYIGLDGAVVIRGHILLTVEKHVYNKWGKELNLKDILFLHDHNRLTLIDEVLSCNCKHMKKSIDK